MPELGLRFSRKAFPSTASPTFTPTDTPSLTSEHEFAWKLLYLVPNPLQK